MTDDEEYLVCPSCEYVAEPPGPDPAADPSCPDCGSDRAYRATDPALPDADTESYVKLDPDAVDDS